MLREADSVSLEEDMGGSFTPAFAMSTPGAAAIAMPTQRFGEGKSFNWSGAALTLFLHILLIGGFFMIRDHIVTKHQERLTVVNLSPAPPPPPSTPEQPTPQKVAIVTPRPAVIIPVPTTVSIPTTPDPVPQPTPPAPAVSAAPPAPPAPPSVVQASDLGSRMVSGKPPSYPLDSRRNHEMGTVVLSLTLGYDGHVESISVSKSSGFARLDDAALSSVRKWRWEPVLRGGQPVMVRGLVEIPFVLRT